MSYDVKEGRDGNHRVQGYWVICFQLILDNYRLILYSADPIPSPGVLVPRWLGREHQYLLTSILDILMRDERICCKFITARNLSLF